MPSEDVEASVKLTVSGSTPDSGVAEKAAAGPASGTACSSKTVLAHKNGL